jgi:hypothetical protein
MTQDSGTPSLSGRKLAIFAVVSLAGLVGAWDVAKRVTYASQGFDQSREYENCDDCALTTLLDGLPYLLGVLAAYVVLVAVMFVLIKRRGGFTR